MISRECFTIVSYVRTSVAPSQSGRLGKFDAAQQCRHIGWCSGRAAGTPTKGCSEIRRCLFSSYHFPSMCRFTWANRNAKARTRNSVKIRTTCTNNIVTRARTPLTSPAQISAPQNKNKPKRIYIDAKCIMDSGLPCFVCFRFFSFARKITFRCCDINHSVINRFGTFQCAHRFSFSFRVDPTPSCSCTRRWHESHRSGERKPNYMRHWLWR